MNEELNFNKKNNNKFLSENIEKILIIKNNITELKRIIKSCEDSIKIIKEGKESSYIDFTLSLIVFCIFTINCITGVFLLAPITLICSIIWFLKGYLLTYKPESKKLKLKQIGLDIYKTQLEEETKKLELLYSKEKNPINDEYLNTICSKRKASELIELLMEKQDVINDYLFRKHIYVELYKNGSLRKELEIYNKAYLYDFIELLIENDLNIKEKNSNKQKVLIK